MSDGSWIFLFMLAKTRTRGKKSHSFDKDFLHKTHIPLSKIQPKGYITIYWICWLFSLVNITEKLIFHYYREIYQDVLKIIIAFYRGQKKE